jgi:PTH1 family peptidyl-tRNA hydrolase
MKLIVGLGNPGAKYARNRHNIGFMAVERIAEAARLGGWRKRFEGETAEGEIGGERCVLLKPLTFMNESGRSVGQAARFLKIEPADVIVLHDELDLAPGRLKIKTGGGNAGHNGLRSISAHIGNEYVRVRLGIGHPGHKDAVHGYVLHGFAKADADWLEPLLDAIGAEAAHLARGDSARFMSEIARRLQPEEEKPAPKIRAAKGPEAAEARSVVKASMARSGDDEPPKPGALADKLKGWLKRKSG